ncbi:hypothetical protein GCM10010515_11850 [Streptomyces fructofermentans]|uniref:Uncharacterized protein n=1 Tax=Streptomyces fructofermentans TaxID=152141 RepID=A0A918N840_9ACTN|nr:hypothetical protein GCM10010515_11850 [Streptomyces fructofermentans]
MPGLLVARVFSGAQVMTVMVPSPEPPVVPGTTPQPAAMDTHAASAPAESALVPAVRRWAGRKVRVCRLPVMGMHDSVTSLRPV